MAKLDPQELELLEAFEEGALKSVATKSELARFKAAARATATNDKHVDIHLSAGDLSDIQVRALQEGVPYQMLIASIVHKYLTGQLTEMEETGKKARLSQSSRKRSALDS